MANEFGKYTLQRKLAEGGMAEVFLARQSGTDGFEKAVVIKRILPQLTSDPQFVEMFVNEARVAARLQHPSIVNIFDLGRVDGQYYIAMEFIHGEDLRTIAKAADLRRSRPSMAIAVRIIADVLGGLHYAHTRSGGDGKPLGLVHRDISPQNVLVSYEGGVKLVDFGIAKATESASSQQTQAGMLKGKYAYMSPEQCRSKKVDARSDIFSVGILLWELVSWSRLFKRDSDLATLVAVADEEIPRVSTVRNDVPPELDAICARALSRAVGDRYPTAQAMQSDLEALLRKYAWEADSIVLQRYMRGLFADKLAVQDEAVRAAGVGSIEELLGKATAESVLPWIEPVVQTNKTPSALITTPESRGRPAPPQPYVPPPMPYAPPPGYASPPLVIAPVPQPMYIAPVPQPRRDGSEFTGSTLRNAVGQSVPVRSTRITAQTGAVTAPPASGWKRMLIVGGTGLVLAGAVLTAVLWPASGVGEAGDRAESATIHLQLDAEAQIFLDGARQLPAKETDLAVTAHHPHELRIKRGEAEKKISVPALDVGATQTVNVTIGG